MQDFLFVYARKKVNGNFVCVRERERERGGGEIEKVREQYKNYASRKGDWLITYMRAARGGEGKWPRK